MLPLSDPRWPAFRANYSHGGSVAALLAQAGAGAPADAWYDPLFQELCHQYTVSEAAYAAAPHLVQLAAARPDCRLDLLVLIGSCYAYAQAAAVAELAGDLAHGWREAAQQAVPMIATLLGGMEVPAEELRYLCAALAAVRGFTDLAAAIERLDTVLE